MDVGEVEELESKVIEPEASPGEKTEKSLALGKATEESGARGGKSERAATPQESTVPLLQLYSFSDKFDYFLMCFGLLGATGHGIALPLLLAFFGKLLNGLGSSEQQMVDEYALYFVYVSIFCLGSSWLEIAFWVQTGQRQSARMRAKYLQALLRQDVAYFDTDTNTGREIHIMAMDILAVQDAISEKTGHFFHHVATFVASFAISFYLQWRMAAVTLAIIPVITITGGVYAYFLTNYTTKTSSANTQAGSIVQEAISQVPTVQSFVAEEKFMEHYSEALQKTMKLGIKSGLVKGLGLGVTFLIVFSTYAILLTYGMALVRKKESNGGEVLATILNIVIGSTSIALAMSNVPPFSKAQVAAFKIFQVINHEPTINKPDHDNAETPQTLNGHIELRNVAFSYPSRPDVPIFQNFSLIIPPGKSVAIVGSSGSGKSTVVSLIERFYDPTGGEVLLDGINLKKLDLKWLRKQIGLVNQEPVLFAMTIGANIKYGLDDASQEEIEEASKAANAHTFISELPNGYETQVGERGIQLSGGQRQRIAIARAIVMNPTVLLLDEATSALDAGSEQVVQEALDRIMVGRTTVVVAHRLSTIRNADTIAVVDQGTIVESGTHNDLISREDGIYSALVLLQELAITSEGTFNQHNSSSSFYSPNFYSPARSFSPGRFSYSPARPRSNVSMSFSFTEEREATYQPNQPEKPVKQSKGSIKRLMAMCQADWKYSLATMAGSIGAGCLSPAMAVILGNVVSDYYDPDHQYMLREIKRFSFYLVIIGVAAVLLYTLQHYSLAVVGERLVKCVREKLFAKILRNELGWFDEEDNHSSQLAARLASDAATVRVVIGDRTSVLLTCTTNMIISFAIAFFLQWRLALIMVLSSYPLITAANVFEHWLLTGLAKDQAKAYERARQVAGEAVGNIRTVAAFSAEDKVEALFARELEGPSKQSSRKGHVAGFGYGVSQFLLYSSTALGLWYAGRLVSSGQSGLPAALKTVLVILISAFVAAEAVSIAPDLINGRQAITSLFLILDRVTKIEPDDSKGEKTEKIRGDIQMIQVSLAYPSRPDVLVLRDLNLKVKAGRSLAVVGASGSGKTSIIALIERFHDPLSGEILIDRRNIRNYNLQFLRKHIALVQQEPALFSTTVYDNILYGKAGAGEAEVIEAARAANAHKFISSLPDGYSTLVGERGVQLSGGQKQRVAIARAVLKDPTILLLDEATSALDAKSENVVQAAVERLMKGRTTLIVAHRLSTIRGADSIAVVQDGSIAEQGSHGVLLAADGAYSRLIRFQQYAENLVVD